MQGADRGGRGRRSLTEKYETFASDAARRLRADALGTGVVNGYTTPEQASRLATGLGLGEGRLLLDLGAGRGWPGSFIASETGCDLVVCDLPMAALLEARSVLAGGPLVDAGLVRADGRALPFADGSFDAVTHADVLC